MKLLMTGATGYLGKRLAVALHEYGFELVFLVRKKSNTAELSRLIKNGEYLCDTGQDFSSYFKGKDICGVVHCATHYGRRDSDPLNTVTANLILPLRLLHAAAGSGSRFFINTGTLLDKRVSPYSLSKFQFEDWMRHYSDNILCINMLLEHFYGPNDDSSKFVSNIVNALKSDVAQIDLTLGEQKRDFIYVDDVVSAFIFVIKSLDFDGKGFLQYEVGSSSSISIRDFVDLAKEISNNTNTILNYGAIPYRKNEVMNSAADTSALQKLGWTTSVSLVDGLQKCFDGENK